MIGFRGARTTVWHGVISMTSERVAFKEPFYGEPTAPEGTVEAKSLCGVIGTGGIEAAASAWGERVKDR